MGIFVFYSGIMITKLKAPISVFSIYNHKKGWSIPKVIIWEGRNYLTKKIGYHHTYKEGKILFHVFSVLANSHFFKIKHNTQNLSWELEEISDGAVN